MLLPCNFCLLKKLVLILVKKGQVDTIFKRKLSFLIVFYMKGLQKCLFQALNLHDLQPKIKNVYFFDDFVRNYLFSGTIS